MTREVVTASPEEPLSEALARLQASRLRCLPVVEAGHLLGLLLANDPGLEAAPPGARVRGHLRPPTASIHPRALIERAALLMLEHDIRGLPVVDDGGRLVGVLTARDLLAAIVESPPVVLWP